MARNSSIYIESDHVLVLVILQTVAVGNSCSGRLPTTVENDTFVYRDMDIVTIESALGFVLRCNMKFEVCMFDVSGE